MAQEFAINSSAIESKINQLLPSQGGFGAGVDFSASTMVIPIIDLTETATGSGLRQDLQTSLSHTTSTNTYINQATNTTIVNTTGYYSVIATCGVFFAQGLVELNLFDGTTSKPIVLFNKNQFVDTVVRKIQLNVAIKAGESLRGTCVCPNINDYLSVTTRQLADINGNLTDP